MSESMEHTSSLRNVGSRGPNVGTLKELSEANRLFVGTRPNLIPNPAMQHQPVHVTADSQPRDYFFARQVNRYGNERHPNLYLRFRRVQTIATAASANGPTNGVVVISGDMQSKHLEFVFQTSGALGTIPIPDEQWERFHDDDQMTPWQEQAFPKGQPHGGHRSRNGHLRDGEPVFFLCDPSKVDAGNPQGLVFFGRAQMFRFPYDETPTGLVPSVLRNAGLDLTEALFGRVPVKMSCGDNEQPDRKAIKGRVFFEDCVVHGQGEWLEPQIVPQILGSPKVTAYQQYLTQDRSAKSTDHTTYINGDRTTIRGHKLYWHRWDGTGLGQVTVQPPEQHRRLLDDLRSARPRDTQHTLIQPVVATSPTGTRTTFTGRIRFENLTDIELGALLSALNLPQNCAHKIGMAKPLDLHSLFALLQLWLRRRWCSRGERRRTRCDHPV